MAATTALKIPVRSPFVSIAIAPRPWFRVTVCRGGVHLREHWAQRIEAPATTCGRR